MTEKYIPGATRSAARQRLQHEITTQLQIRLVKMIRACTPLPSGSQAWLCLGVQDDPPSEDMSDL